MPTDEYLRKVTLGERKPLNSTILLREYDPTWPEQYRTQEKKISHALSGQPITIQHVGSTSVPGLCAQPILAILLLVADSAPAARSVRSRKGGRNMRTHRVGTITFGCVLILFGILFIIHMFVPSLTYDLIFRLWPCMFILLGIEVLLSNVKLKNTTFVYDKTSIFLLIILTFFTFIMAWVETEMNYQQVYWQLHF